jgi:hypothetical protein
VDLLASANPEDNELAQKARPEATRMTIEVG